MTAALLHDPEQAATLLRAGKLVAIPTETVYGLGANALNEKAVAAIFTAKERPAFDPLIIHQSSAERVLQWAHEVFVEARQLADEFWPGPLTLVLPKVAAVPDLVTAGLETVALRVPAHPLTKQLLEQLDFPLAAPSANPFGFVSPTTALHVMGQLGNHIAAVLDGGPCRVGLESTIVGFPHGNAVIYRKGGLTTERINEALGRSVEVRSHGSSRPAAPGMLSRHYSPGIPIELRTRVELPTNPAPGVAYVVFGRGKEPFPAGARAEANVYDLSPNAELTEAAARLFAILRALRERPYHKAIIELLPEQGLGRAVNDRLRRAAATT